MKHSPLNPLSQAARTLLGKLVSWPALSKHWSGGDETTALLEQIGTTANPTAIPTLLSFCLAGNTEVRNKAKSTVSHLYSQMPIDSLPVLDEAVRQSWGQCEDWYGLNSNLVKKFAGVTEDDLVFLGLASCHRNGFVRAQAILALGRKSSPIVIPFLLLRLVDWVSEVRAAAEVEISRKLTTEYGSCFVDCLPLIDRLSKNSRFRPESQARIEQLLREPECGEALWRGVQSKNLRLRRLSFRLAILNPAIPAKPLMKAAMRDADVATRKWAFAAVRQFLPADEFDWVQAAATDPYGPIRRMAFEALVTKSTRSADELRPFLLDRSAAIRRACQAEYARFLDKSPRGEYASALQDAPARVLDICIVGLAETGDRDDIPTIFALLEHRTARVRRAVIRGLRILGIEGRETALLRVVALDVRSVARDAASALLWRRASPAREVWLAALRNSDPSVPRHTLRLMKNAPKWQQLLLYAGAALSSDRELTECAIEMLGLWLNRFNQSFVQPSSSELDSAADLLTQAAERLPIRLNRELRFILDTSAR